MLNRSGSGAYSRMANALAAATKASSEKGGASDPQVIVKLGSPKNTRIFWLEVI
jgi:hypothetical protein